MTHCAAMKGMSVQCSPAIHGGAVQPLSTVLTPLPLCKRPGGSDPLPLPVTGTAQAQSITHAPDTLDPGHFQGTFLPAAPSLPPLHCRSSGGLFLWPSGVCQVDLGRWKLLSDVTRTNFKCQLSSCAFLRRSATQTYARALGEGLSATPVPSHCLQLLPPAPGQCPLEKEQEGRSPAGVCARTSARVRKGPVPTSFSPGCVPKLTTPPPHTSGS
jgi:hypothetical protein